MDNCIKCGGETIKKKQIQTNCNCIICLSCGYVEFYATKDDLAKFNEKRG